MHVDSEEQAGFCIELQRKPAYYSAGVRKHWARNKLSHLPHSFDGGAEAEHFARGNC
jgi:hypothetical protein